MEKPLLKITDLEIEFLSIPKIYAVRKASISLYPNETLALIGESGCGKTVLCKSILGLLCEKGRITGGSIQYLEKEIAFLSDRARKKLRGSEIAMVFQNPMTAFNPVITVGEQIAEVFRINKLPRKKAREQTEHLLDLVGIALPEKRYRQYPHEFSGGMLQRAAIAAALAASPRILIADEPTTALDMSLQKEILSLLQRVQKETKTAILLITHDLRAAAQIADRIAVMYAGRVLEIGTVQEIFQNPCHPYTQSLLRDLNDLYGHSCRTAKGPCSSGIRQIDHVGNPASIQSDGNAGQKNDVQETALISVGESHFVFHDFCALDPFGNEVERQ